MPAYVGTAAWSIPREYAERFPSEGSHLVRYAARLNGVEINSSFYREHQPQTYARWARDTPPGFRFSVKLSRRFTHHQRLAVAADDLEAVLDGPAQLGEKLGVLLVQLPPKLAFDPRAAEAFFDALRGCYGGPVALEPRHATWGRPGALALLESHRLSRVIADPDPCGFAPRTLAMPADLRYFRLHGSPEVYRSRYEGEALARWIALAAGAAREGEATWCIFDNTALGFATRNALEARAALAATGLV